MALPVEPIRGSIVVLRERPNFKLSLKLSFALALVFALTAPLFARAESTPFTARWTAKDDAVADFSHIVDTLNGKAGTQLSLSDFMIFEDINLATSHFRMYVQTAAGLPIQNRSVRVWTDLKTGQVIQVEAQIEPKTSTHLFSAKVPLGKLNQRTDANLQKRLLAIAKSRAMANNEDPHIRSIAQRDEWQSSDLVRVFTIKGKRGTHIVRVSLSTYKLLGYDYREFLKADQAGEMSVPAMIFPIYEDAEGILQPRAMAQLKHLKTRIAKVNQDPFSILRLRRYLSDKQDPVLGLTPQGQADGAWSMPDVKRHAALIRSQLPLSDNAFAAGLILEGRYATVSLHPDASKLAGLTFQPTISAQFKPQWSESDSGDEMVPAASLLGRPLRSFEDAFLRPARRYADNNPTSLLNDGFDEIQVYYAIDTLMDSLQQMGFQDPELSTRPFNAFLYDPDISMRDNAFYTDDTINFTTYSPGSTNYARDNTTIWHELGHGVMDRLMGDTLNLTDSGGLAEGMADFVASLVIAKVTNGQSFEGQEKMRIVNRTAFFLTNESHDDGEAYGGSMYDLLNAARAKYGEAGTTKVADLTMEAMRLSRNSPSLDAPAWFNHMLFADELGHDPVRAPGELRVLILTALAGRNFEFDPASAAKLTISYKDQDVDAGKDGSRGKPIVVSLHDQETAQFEVKIKAHGSSAYPLNFPLKVKLGFNGGPLQGSVHWVGEEQGNRELMLTAADQDVSAQLSVTGKCDAINREDGSCSDFVYIQIFRDGDQKPIGKKRFYVRVKPQG